MDDAADFIGLLEALVEQRLDFIVVGDVAGILAGSPVITVVLEVTCQPSSENLSRAEETLRALHARHYVKDTPGTELSSSELEARRRHRLVTDLGRIDIAQEVVDEHDYRVLVENAIEYHVDGLSIKALNLKTLIEMKEGSSRPEDRYSLLFLKQLVQMAKLAEPVPAG